MGIVFTGIALVLVAAPAEGESAVVPAEAELAVAATAEVGAASVEVASAACADAASAVSAEVATAEVAVLLPAGRQLRQPAQVPVTATAVGVVVVVAPVVLDTRLQTD